LPFGNSTVQNASRRKTAASEVLAAADGRADLCSGILTAIGNTPLIPMRRLFPDARFSLYGKLEMVNPGGSIKDRTALTMLLDAYSKGRIGKGTTIVESSSGNLGIGLAQVCQYLGLRFICVVDTRITPTNMAILRTYGAEVDIVEHPDPVSGDLLTARIARVRQLCETVEGAFWVNQYANPANAKAHHQTMAEIDRALKGRLDYLFVSTSTCGTLRGCSEYVRNNQLRTKVIAVDAVGSVIFGQKPKKRLIPGHGASRMPELYEPGLEHQHVHVTDQDCVEGCRTLLRSEAVFAGGSSGGVVMAISKMRSEIPAGSTVVAILCDRGERYLDTIYSEAWIQEHFAPECMALGA
jgi:N-(2-amino-2-carboxyethyl)-L-glutamate synthase